MKEKVLELLTTQYDALSIDSLVEMLELNTTEEITELQDVLNQLVSSYELYLTKKNKYILLEKCPNFKVGIIDVKNKTFENKDGKEVKKTFGFLIMEDGTKDIHIEGKEYLNGALDGDKVLVEVLGTNPNKPEGKVLKILERDKRNIVGEVKVIASKKVFVTDDKRFKNNNIFIAPEDLNECVEGEIVAVTLDEELSNKDSYVGTIKAKVGHKDDPGMDILEVAAQYDVFEEFPADAMAQAESLPTEVTEKDRYGRRDLTDKVIYTIDGKDTKDIDDAIGVEKLENENYKLYVSIADVSYYVPEGSPLDREALNRATSNYPADKVIPMLPHILSNGICSLNEDVDRCAITCEMEINPQGRVVDSEVYPSIIHSRKKMNYTDCNRILDNDIEEGYEDYVEQLKLAKDLHDLIRKERNGRGAVDFDTVEPKFVFDEKHHAIDVIARERGEFEKVIEDFMIVANESVARKFQYYKGLVNGLPAIYRVHDLPVPEKVQQFVSFCNSIGQKIVGKYKTIENAKAFKNLLDQINAEGEEKEIIMKQAIRTMAKAIYSKNNIGHFGLSSPCYTHFTSPIRRYPDLLVHRLLRTYFFEGLTDKRTVQYWDAHIDDIAKQSSDRERNADELERAVDDMYMADYMTDHIGEEYDAIVSGVTGFGLFVQLPNRVEGLLKYENMANDSYTYDEEKGYAIGTYNKKIFRPGSLIHVRCISASKSLRQTDFEQYTSEEKKKAK